MASATPATVGPYRVERELGSGGWSTVYEVSDAGGRRWALKRLREAVGGEAQARFRREVELLARVDDPGVIRLVDAGIDEGVPYLVTPVLVGVTVRALLSGGAVPPALACAVIGAAARAVAAIHAAGLVHRDLKPENLIVTRDGDVVVIDLGLALAPASTRYTAEHALTGSVPYMAPEQIDARAPSAASDVWALAVMMFEACAGRRPFERGRGSEEVAAILAGRAPALAEVAPAVSEALSALVTRALALEPSARPRADELALTLAGEVADGDGRGLCRRWLADADGTRAALVAAAVEDAVARAEAALAAGERFAAAREIERGLAGRADEPRLRALEARALAGGAAPEVVARAAPARPAGRRRRRWLVGGGVALVAAAAAIVAWQAGRAPIGVDAEVPPGTGVIRPAHVRPSGAEAR